MKKLLFFILAIIGISSCNSNNAKKPADTKDVAEEHNEAKFDDNKQENDAQFLVNAAEIDLEVINSGKLAEQKGTASHIKELGKMMQEHHQKSLNNLTALAKSKMITIPTTITDNGNDAYNKLNEKAGKDFDKAYADMMVSVHKDAISAFEKTANESADADISTWAKATLPELRNHLDQSITCQKLCEEK